MGAGCKKKKSETMKGKNRFKIIPSILTLLGNKKRRKKEIKKWMKERKKGKIKLRRKKKWDNKKTGQKKVGGKMRGIRRNTEK